MNTKSLLLLFLLAATTCSAGVKSLCVEDVPAAGEAPGFKRVTAYGLLSNGRPKVVNLTSEEDKAKCSNVENCALFNLNRNTIRFWAYYSEADISTPAEFDEVGDLVAASQTLLSEGGALRIDFHMAETFESEIWDWHQFDNQCRTHLQALKTLIESKP